jgi:hypothetical protein
MWSTVYVRDAREGTGYSLRREAAYPSEAVEWGKERSRGPGQRWLCLSSIGRGHHHITDAPVVRGERSKQSGTTSCAIADSSPFSAGKPYIPALPASPSLDIAFFSGPNAPPPSYTMPSTTHPTSYTARSTYGPIPALSSPPHEDLPLPPVPRANPSRGNVQGTTLSPTPRTASRSPSPIPAIAGVRSPSPLNPSYLGGSHLQGLGLGPVHRAPINGQPRAASSPIVHVIASSDPHSRAGHRDLPPILTTPAQTSYRSVSASSPHIGSPAGRKPSAPPALELKQSNNYRQYAPLQLLSPGKGMTSPGFSPTNVVVDSLIEEMQDEDGPAPAAAQTPVRKTSILDRPRPRANSRSSSYRADPLSYTPTHQTTFSPGLQDSTSPSRAFRNHYFRPAAKLTDIIQHERIQQTLLPNLSIASFLALLGALDKRWRKCISGEIVGKWVVREWGLVLGPDVAWPGLGVWEGFREWYIVTKSLCLSCSRSRVALAQPGSVPNVSTTLYAPPSPSFPLAYAHRPLPAIPPANSIPDNAALSV